MKLLGKMLILIILSLIFNDISAHKLMPTSHGCYVGGSLLPNNAVYFSGSTSHDNDSQNGGYTPLWLWDFDYKGGTLAFSPSNSSVWHVYTKPGTYTVAVRYRDNDGQNGNIYTFQITIMGSESYYYIKDHLGSIRQTIDESGVIVAAQDYYAYGEIIPGRSYNAGMVDEKYKFTEKERDIETNYDYFGARYYNSKIGLWNSVDPLADKYLGISPYTYCLGNPLRLVDPDGKEPITITAAGVVVAGAVTIALAGHTYNYLTNNSYRKSYDSFINSSIIVGKTVVSDLINKMHNWFNSNEGVANADGGEEHGITIPDEDKIPNSELNPPSKRGNAPTSKIDRKPVEIHHIDGDPNGSFKEMTQGDHRGKGNFKKNHPDLKGKSKIDRTKFDKDRKKYWKKEYDSGRFKDIQ